MTGGGRYRAIGVALAGVPVVCALTLWGDLVIGSAPWGSGCPPLGPTLLLVALVGGNALVGRRWPGGRLSRGELLFVYAVWAVVAGLPGRGMLLYLLPNITAHRYYEGAGRAALFGDWVPPMLVPGRPDAVRALYEGAPGAAVPGDTWAGPLLWWSALYLALWLVPLGLSLLIGVSWVREERLAFPAVEIPLAIVGDGRSLEGSPPSPPIMGGVPRALRSTPSIIGGLGGLSSARSVLGRVGTPTPGSSVVGQESGRGSLWSQPAFWIGLAIPVLLHVLNALHAANPLFPDLPLADVNLDAAVAGRPWSALRPLRLSLFPSLIGILYLAPVDLLFSFWFFWALGRGVRVVGELGGLTEPGAPFGASTFPYTEAQGAGAFLTLALWLLWLGRRPLWDSLRQAATGRGEEVGRCRFGWLMLLVGWAGLLVWARGVGWSLPLAAVFFGLLLANALVVARLVAEAGFLWPLGPVGPESVILLAGSAHLSPATLTLMALQFQHSRDPRGWLAPHFFQGQRLAEEASRPTTDDRPPSAERRAPTVDDLSRAPSTQRRALLTVTWLAALLLALGVTVPMALAVIQERGGLALGGVGRWAFRQYANEPFQRLAAWLQEPTEPNGAGAVAMGAGALVTLLLAIARARLPWWPFHPLGYALSGSPEQLLYAQIVPSIFLAWIFKQATLRWGGLPLYRILRPAAIGLVLGEFAMGALGTMSAALTGVAAYPIWPG